eukprot:1161557-Pelagomonas_calceolata.AAC.2
MDTPVHATPVHARVGLSAAGPQQEDNFDGRTTLTLNATTEDFDRRTTLTLHATLVRSRASLPTQECIAKEG